MRTRDASDFICPKCTSVGRNEDHSVLPSAARVISLSYLRYVQESRASGISCLNRLLGAEHDDLAVSR
jgi:hypothetical protein